ncbi:MAG: hypothetical protein ACTSSJ_04800 [Candidatus Odinarchaeia archaeon]
MARYRYCNKCKMNRPVVESKPNEGGIGEILKLECGHEIVVV